MPDPLILERLQLIMDHALTIHSRMQQVTDSSYFISTPIGEQVYDSLITRLQAMGENFKKIDRLDSHFIANQLNFDSTPIVRFRDLISHHYELLDYQVVFRICKIEIPVVIHSIEQFLEPGTNNA